MIFPITRINRTADLDDALVQKYCEYDELREQPFAIVLRTKFGHAPSKEEISDEDLSKLCNEILLSELKAFALLPKALSIIEEQVKNGEMNDFMECDIK